MTWNHLLQSRSLRNWSFKEFLTRANISSTKKPRSNFLTQAWDKNAKTKWKQNLKICEGSIVGKISFTGGCCYLDFWLTKDGKTSTILWLFYTATHHTLFQDKIIRNKRLLKRSISKNFLLPATEEAKLFRYFQALHFLIRHLSNSQESKLKL